jgi:AcrR family transcriptional regulator
VDDDGEQAARPGPVQRDGRDSRWERHREERRAALVDATIRAIRTHGAGVGMDDIAAEAGTSKTVIYRHFEDKAGLYRAVAARIDGRVVGNVGAALRRSSAPHGDTRELVASTVDAYLALVESDAEVYRFVVNRPLVDLPLPDDPVGGTVDQVTDQLTGLLLDSLSASATDPSRARTWAIALVGSVRAVADDWLATPEADRAPRAAVVESLTQLAWLGLAPALAPTAPRNERH